jgi:hypothetical protein
MLMMQEISIQQWISQALSELLTRLGICLDIREKVVSLNCK